MGAMRTLLPVVVLAGLINASPVAVAQSSGARPVAQAPVADAVDRVIDEAIHDRAFAGAAIGIAQNGRISLIRGYGLADLEQRVPVTEKTVFRIGSVTKQFTAAAILKLADQGKLAIDDPLAKYLPDFPRASEVTLRQLLSHTSGVSSYTNPAIVKDPTAGRKEWTTETMIAHIAGLQPGYEFEPGTGWSYSNSGYVLLGAVIEKVSGKPYRDFLKSEILDPVELFDTAVDDLAQIVPNRARGYDVGKDAPSGFANADFISMSAAGPAGAMRSTVADLLKWHLALFGGRVLKPETLALMTAPAHLKDGRLSSLGRRPPFWVPATTEYGFGLFLDQIDGHQAIGHGGAINGFNTWMETFPDRQLTLVILANTSYPAAEHTGPKLAAAVLKAMTTP
jgi:CubicO group peptidase (beta-lactamase class C family)